MQTPTKDGWVCERHDVSDAVPKEVIEQYIKDTEQ